MRAEQMAERGRLTVVVNLRLPKTEDEALDALALKTGKSKAEITRTCIQAGLDWAQRQVEKGRTIISL